MRFDCTVRKVSEPSSAVRVGHFSLGGGKRKRCAKDEHDDDDDDDDDIDDAENVCIEVSTALCE